MGKNPFHFDVRLLSVLLVLTLSFLPGCANTGLVCGTSSPTDPHCDSLKGIAVIAGVILLGVGTYYLIRNTPSHKAVIRGTCFLQDSTPPSHSFPQICPMQELQVLEVSGATRETIRIDNEGRFVYEIKSRAPFRLAPANPKFQIIEQEVIDGREGQNIKIHLKAM